MNMTLYLTALLRHSQDLNLWTRIRCCEKCYDIRQHIMNHLDLKTNGQAAV